MFTRKVDRHFLSVPQWCSVALILCGAAVAGAQFGGGGQAPPSGKPAEGSAAEQSLFPNGLPKMETMLKATLEHHPDVLTARSRVRAAEADLRQAEFKALKEMVDVRLRWQKANTDLALAKDGRGSTFVPDGRANLAAVEWELSFLLGTRGEPASAPKGAIEKGGAAPQAAADVPVLPAAVEGAIPRGEQAKSIKKKLGQPITVNMEATPLNKFVRFLSDESGLRFIFDKQALEEDGFPTDTPIEAMLGEVELGSALQMLEDSYHPLYFVVREYGILVTTQSHQSSKTVSAHDFWKLTEDELVDKLRQQRQEELSTPGGGMGGGQF